MSRSFFGGVALALALSGCATAVKPTPNPVDVPILARSLGPGLVLEIDPRLELLAGVQAWTSWTTNPRSDGYWGEKPRAYAQELRSAFASFRTSAAVTLAEDLLRYRGFSYDAPPAFVLAPALLPPAAMAPLRSGTRAARKSPTCTR